MKGLADPVTTKFADDRIPCGFGMLLDRMADIPQANAWPDHLYALPHGFVGHGT